MKLILCLSVIIVLSLGLASAGRTECTRNGGCVSYDNNGGGLRCGPGGCQQFGPSQRYPRNVQNELYSCGSNGCVSRFGFSNPPPGYQAGGHRGKLDLKYN